MILKVSLTTRADRNYSGDSYTVSHEELEEGICVNRLFPDSYHNFVDRIFVKAMLKRSMLKLSVNMVLANFP